MNNSKNYWNEFEYDKLKLLCHNNKVQSILEVGHGTRMCDELPPISVELQLTNNCNLNCPWCTDRDLHDNRKELSVKKCMELLYYFGQQGTGVTLEGGGEPSIHSHFKEIVDYGYAHDVDMGLITNGTTDLSDIINKLKWVRISLDAGNKDEYQIEKGKDFFDRVLSNIEKYTDIRDAKHCFLGVGYVLTSRNMNHIPDIVEKLNMANVDYIYFRPVEEAPEIIPTRDTLYDLRKQLLDLTATKRIKFNLLINDRLEKNNAGLPCIAHSLTSIIHADGDVYCCEKRRHDLIVYGNVYQNRFEDIWSSSLRRNKTKHLLCNDSQLGCGVCRITSFNRIFYNLMGMNTTKFI